MKNPRNSKSPLPLPIRLKSYRDFDKAVLRARQIYTGIDTDVDRRRFLNLMYYLLGWFLGDLGKQFGNRELMTAGLNLTLTKRHPENQALGDFVFFECIQKLGIQARRQRDRKPDNSSPYGAYLWDCRRSPLFGWFHVVCLGLKWEERASRHPVKMDWILSAPLELRLWFIRGLADSDGDVHVSDKSVGITTSPNRDFINSLLKSVGCRTHVEISRRFDKVVIALNQAVRIKMFNPEILTHRRKILEKLASAKTFPRHWPRWLQEKVTKLLSSGQDVKEVRNKILDEDNVFVRLRTLQKKKSRYQTNQAGRHDGAEGGMRAPDPQIAPPSPGL
jgi:hypothetical protein